MGAISEMGVREKSPPPGTIEEQFSRLSRTIEKAPIGIANGSPAGQWLMVNRHLCDMLGYSAPELMKRTFQDITYPAESGGRSAAS